MTLMDWLGRKTAKQRNNTQVVRQRCPSKQYMPRSDAASAASDLGIYCLSLIQLFLEVKWICLSNRTSMLRFPNILLEDLSACAQRRQTSLCIRAVWPKSSSYKEILQSQLSKICSVKILVRLRKCAGWSESKLGAHVRRYVFCRWALVYMRL